MFGSLEEQFQTAVQPYHSGLATWISQERFPRPTMRVHGYLPILETPATGVRNSGNYGIGRSPGSTHATGKPYSKTPSWPTPIPLSFQVVPSGPRQSAR